VVKKVYKLSFGLKGIATPQGSTWKVLGKIYFDFSRNNLFMDHDSGSNSYCFGTWVIARSRAEGKRFCSWSEHVQDLEQVLLLVVEKFLFLDVFYFHDRTQRNPWDIFSGVKGVAYWGRIVGEVDDRDLKAVAPLGK
jgi:hypothetical protein